MLKPAPTACRQPWSGSVATARPPNYREFTNPAVGTRAVRLVCAYAFERLGLERLELFTLPGNAASERVAERAGFQREGVLRSHSLADDLGLLEEARRRLLRASPTLPSSTAHDHQA